MVDYGKLLAAAARGEADFVLQHADGVLMNGDCPPEKVGWVFYLKSDAAQTADKVVLAIAAGEQALSWAQQHSDIDLEGRVRLCLSNSLLRIGRVADAASLLEAYVACLDQHAAWKQFEDIARYNLAVAYRHSGRLSEAVQQYRRALELPESRVGLKPQIRQNLAWALILLGDAEGAREQLEAVAENVRETLSLSRLTSLWVDKAALSLLDGDIAKAKAACQQVLDALDDRQRRTHLSTTYITLGRIALVEGQREEAQRCSMVARNHAEKAERWDLHNEATRLWIDASEKGGTPHEETVLATAARLLVIGRNNR